MLGNSRRNRTIPAPNVGKGIKPANMILKDQNQNVGGKRPGDGTQNANQKRAAMGDITNALAEKSNIKVALKKSKLIGSSTLKPSTGQALKPIVKEGKPKKVASKKVTKSSSNEKLNENSTSLSQGSAVSSNDSVTSSSSSYECLDIRSQDDILVPVEEVVKAELPEGVEKVDEENLADPVQVALYAFDIFNYYKERELMFAVTPYMTGRKALTASMRAILVDWLVEVQENFELNHETLYLAVKLVDLFVCKKEITKEILQLVGAASLFIASKFDERCPPLVEDFLYICDDAYKRHEFLEMERCILRTIDFDIGFPLSYRFLRRYAKCGRASMETLTLARYILEMSLMEYEFITERESRMGAASLLLALRMKKAGEWTQTLEFYTGYSEKEMVPLIRKLNAYISAPPKQLTTIRSKYSHKVFYEVAKISPLSDEVFV